ncbi:MAG: hypothetical protein GXO71_06255 [Caldiserica bacterium]|nr:hypothetical protein [Caldisericota bacterium]
MDLDVEGAENLACEIKIGKAAKAADEVAKLIKQGYDPAKIAQSRKVSEDITLRTLRRLVGEGRLRRSDIFYSIPKEKRHLIEETIRKRYRGKKVSPDGVTRSLRRRGVDIAWIEVAIFINYHEDASTAFGDLYQDIRSIEIYLHDLIRKALEEAFGPGEAGWWRKGVPLRIRQKCQERREEDEESPSQPWDYTDLLDLGYIMEKHWVIFQKVLPKQVSNRKRLLSDILHLNEIRRVVMHPVRYKSPREIDSDFDFVRAFKIKFGIA